jgi:bacterial/archaeal transporter family-2 protein
MDDLKNLPWWAVFGGLVGAVQVFARLTLVGRVGAGTFMAVTVSSALVTSLPVDHFGWFCMEVHSVTPLRALGDLLLIGGAALEAKA